MTTCDAIGIALVVALFGSPVWIHLIALLYLLWREPGIRPWSSAAHAGEAEPTACRCGERDCVVCGGGGR